MALSFWFAVHVCMQQWKGDVFIFMFGGRMGGLIYWSFTRIVVHKHHQEIHAYGQIIKLASQTYNHYNFTANNLTTENFYHFIFRPKKYEVDKGLLKFRGKGNEYK